MTCELIFSVYTTPIVGFNVRPAGNHR